MEIMTAWKEQGICEYPMALCPESGYEMESMSTVFGAFINHETFDEKMLATKPVIMWDGVKEGFGYLNQLYNAGLIQPDWAQYTDDTQYKNWGHQRQGGLLVSLRRPWHGHQRVCLLPVPQRF